MAQKTQKKRQFVAPVMPPLEPAEAASGGAESARAAPKFPEIGDFDDAPLHETIDLKPAEGDAPRTPQKAAERSREVLFQELNAEPDPLERLPARAIEHPPGGPTLIPTVTPGDPSFALFVVAGPDAVRGAMALRGSQLSIRVDPSVGLTHQQELIAVLQLPNYTHVQLESWVESVAPDAAVVIGSLDASNFAEVRLLLVGPEKKKKKKRVSRSTSPR